MSTVVERLIESWLDSQAERRYQPAFIQLLISEGWSVLHNTRHSPIEQGKDVIARDPNGVLYCFQLKGNPGSRLTKSEAQRLLPQFLELLELPVALVYRSSSQERHIAVLVTNGEIDEEARLELEVAADRVKSRFCPARRVEFWSRGVLLPRFRQCAGKVWPTSISGTRQVLELMTHDGREIPSAQAISRVFNEVSPTPSRKTSSAAKTASLASLLLIAEIIKSPWYAAQNHYGLYVVSVLASVHALRLSDTATRRASVTQYAELCIEHCLDLLAEAKERGFNPEEVWAERSVADELDVMYERRRLIGDCAATLVLSGKRDIDYDADYAKRLIEVTVLRPKLWGLGAVPAAIVRYWAACRVFADAKPDISFARQLDAIVVSGNEDRSSINPLPSPYYSFTDCWALGKGIRYFADDWIFTESFQGRAWFARAMLFMLAKRNWKQTCKILWPSFSRLVHEEPDLPDQAFFDALLCNDGRMQSYTYHRKDWADLVEESVDAGRGVFLAPFASMAWLIAAYVAIVPYRAWTGVLMWLDQELNATWYHQDYLPPS